MFKALVSLVVGSVVGILLALDATVAQPSAFHQRALRGVRAEFVEAHIAAVNGLDVSGGPDSSRLKRYLLYPYLTAARLDRRLRDADGRASEVDSDTYEFLSRHDGEPVSFTLHRRWISSLARRHAWLTLIDAYDPELASTTHVCQYMAARIALGDTAGLAEDITRLWLSPAQLPIECEPAFEWLRQAGILDDDLTERRARMLLDSGEVGFARIIARRLPDTRTEPLLRWARLLQNPISEFDAIITEPRPGVLPEAIDSAWPRFTRANPSAALERFELLLDTQQVDLERRSRLARDLALGLAWDRRAQDAIGMFASVAAEHMDDYALEWLVRAALWSGDWRLVASAIQRMSAPSRQQTVWRYWRGRSAAQLGEDSLARELLDSVIVDDNYYSANAAAHLGRETQPHSESLARNRAAMRALNAQPAFARARELLATGLRTEATREWRFAYQMLSDEEREQAVHVAASWAWFDMEVASATTLGIFNDYELLYPLQYSSEVATAARLSQLPQALIFGLIRQESLFREDAVSGAGAIGLTQLMPDTARRTAGAWDYPVPSAAQLFEPQTNVALGAATLKDFADRYDGQLPVALAAYNAGPNAAERWLPEQPIDADVWIENIPYNETRAFVRRVLWHSVVFAWLQSGDAQQTADWLAKIRKPNLD